MTDQLQPGTSFAGYMIERRLGGGGFGDVYLARDNAGRPVAVKVLRGEYQTNEAARLRADIELLAAAASSRSTHIVRVLGGGSEPAPHVVMEYIEGMDLAQDIARRGTLPVHEVMRVAAAIADALSALQQSGIIHRDVKPGNVMIDSQGTIKLTDFGIAKIVGIETPTTVAGELPLSVAYAAPEVFEGKASYLSDHYAFGALLYHCLAGRPPFTGNYAEVYHHHRNTPPSLDQLPAATPPSLRRLIAECLEKDPFKRPGNASVLRLAISQAQVELASAGPAMMALQGREPKAIGPWVIERRSTNGAWTFHCRHEATGERAIVELHFTDDLDYGTLFRRALALNPKLVELGAERILGTSRLVLRPTEAWTEPPPGQFQFWIAREPDQASVSPTNPSAEDLRSAAASLQSMIELARHESFDLSLYAENISLLPGGRVYVRRAGLPLYGDTDPYEEADKWLAAQTNGLGSRALATDTRQQQREVPDQDPWLSPRPLLDPVTAEPRYAGFIRRSLAFLLDAVFVIIFWILQLTVGIVVFGEEFVDEVLVWVTMFTSFPLYHWLFAMWGGTLGMRLFGIRIRPLQGDGKLSAGVALLRTLVLYIGSSLILGCLWPLWDARKQTWHDKASNSVAVLR